MTSDLELGLTLAEAREFTGALGPAVSAELVQGGWWLGLGRGLSEDAGWSQEVPPGAYRGLPATGPAELRARLKPAWSLLCSARRRPEVLRAGHTKYRVDSEPGATCYAFYINMRF